VINDSIADEQHEVSSFVNLEEKYADDSSTDHVVPETPLNSVSPPSSPITVTGPILRSRSLPLHTSVRYSDLQEDEAATRQLKRLLAVPTAPTETRHTQPTHSRKRRRTSRSHSALASAVTVTESVSAPSPRPLQRRKANHMPSVADVAQHGRLYDHVNNGNRQQWIATCSHILRRYHLASIADDNAEKADAFADLLLLPGRVLAKVSRGGKRSIRRGRRTPTTVIRQRLAQQLSGLPLATSEEERKEREPSHTTTHTHNPADSDNERDTDLPTNPLIAMPLSLSDSDLISLDPFDGLTSEEDRSAARRANRLVHHGHIRKAAHVLNSTTAKADLSDPEVLEELRSLHPPLPEGSLFPSLPATAPLVHFDDDDIEIHRILRHSNNGSSAGPSGWGGNMVSILADDTTCRVALLRLMQDVCNDNIPDAIRDLLLSSHLVALRKPSGGLRPIAVGELFYRIAGSIAVRSVRAAATSLLVPHQYGFGLRNGCEQIVHSLQHSLTDKDRRCAVLQLDLINAFNCVDRPRLLTTLYNTPQLAPIWRIVNLAYATDSPLLLDRGESQFMSSSNGIRQGDPLSSLLFCFYIKDALADVAQCNQVQPYACMDDIHLEGQPHNLMDALQQLQQSLHSVLA
jgi:Reverse transcriptase (RNA-dependent DNA polymerase)